MDDHRDVLHASKESDREMQDDVAVNQEMERSEGQDISGTDLSLQNDDTAVDQHVNSSHFPYTEGRNTLTIDAQHGKYRSSV